MKWPVVLIGIVLIGAVLIFAMSYGVPNVAGIPTSTSSTTTEIIPGTPSTQYSDAQYKFTIMRPQTSMIATSSFDGFLPITHIPVVGFILPKSLFQGSNLVEAGVFIGASAEADAVNACLGPSDQETPHGTTTINGVIYQVFSSTGAGAGNTYEENSLRTVRNGTCFEIVELLHSGNIGNYPTGQVKQFDQNLYHTMLDSMVHTLAFTGEVGSGVQGSVNIACASNDSDPDCLPQNRVIEAYQGVSAVALFKTAQNGTFRTDLPPGRYELRVDVASSTHCASVGVVVTPATFISTNISCEAGAQE
jgi:hypothetical protein